MLLLWALADLSVPGLCKTDADRSQDSQAESPLTDSPQMQRRSVSATLSVSIPAQHSGPTLGEDCFCCCAHIVPASHYSVDSFQFTVPALTFYDFSQVTVAVPSPYHPPRS